MFVFATFYLKDNLSDDFPRSDNNSSIASGLFVPGLRDTIFSYMLFSEFFSSFFVCFLYKHDICICILRQSVCALTVRPNTLRHFVIGFYIHNTQQECKWSVLLLKHNLSRIDSLNIKKDITIQTSLHYLKKILLGHVEKMKNIFRYNTFEIMLGSKVARIIQFKKFNSLAPNYSRNDCYLSNRYFFVSILHNSFRRISQFT